MNAELTIGLISLGVLIIINIALAAVSYGKLMEGQKNLKENLDKHCELNEKQFEKMDERIERVEDVVFHKESA